MIIVLLYRYGAGTEFVFIGWPPLHIGYQVSSILLFPLPRGSGSANGPGNRALGSEVEGRLEEGGDINEGGGGVSDSKKVWL